MEGNQILESGVPRVKTNTKIKVSVAVLLSFIVLCIAASCVGLWTVYRETDSNGPRDPNGRPNIIFMISDGFSPSSETFARTMATAVGDISDQVLLELDYMHVGVSRTYSSMSLITDSAAGATAYACGLKTYNGAIGVDDSEPPKAQGTAMEAAKQLGWTTAIVTTSRITHATPASFSSHMSDRDYEELIAEQQATLQEVDLMFGGGLQKFIQREDQQNLFEVMNERGYQTIQSMEEFQQPLTMPVIGLFAEEHMAYEIDRIREDPISQPSLTEMTSKALDLLKAKDEPFFIMIEGARIDMAAHSHDAYPHYMEIMQYQDTVALVKQFVDENPNTYVVSVADHATGGISTGQSFHNGTYQDPYMWYPAQLLAQTGSTEFMSALIIKNGMQTLNQTVLEYGGIELNDEEYEYIQYSLNVTDSVERTLKSAIGSVISARALIGWTTPGHTGVDVNLYAYGKRPSTLHGVKQNIEVGNELWEEIGLKQTMDEITASLSDMEFPPILGPQNHPRKSCVYAGHN